MTPIVIWLAGTDASALVSRPGTFIAALGKACALAGTALFLFNPFLSARERISEFILRGLDNAVRLHRLNGKVSFYLILLHPILIAVGRMLNGRAITAVWNWTSPLILVGLFALICFTTLVGISIYAHIKHQRWIIIHRLFGWLIPIFLLHAFLARSQMVNNEVLLIYMLAIAAVGFSSFLYRSVLHKYVARLHKYEVKEVLRINDTVTEIVLAPKHGKMNFRAGQYGFVSFESPKIDREDHPFSFSNADNGPYVRFAIKSLGDDTRSFHTIEPGSTAWIDGPYGSFSFESILNHKQVWIAGGIGITPFLSMARSFSGPGRYDIRFFYGAESLDDAVFLQEFMDIARHLPENFDTKIVNKKTSGFVTVDLLQKSLGDLKEYDYLICGPPGMMRALLEQLQKAGVPKSQIHIEAFSM